MAKHDIGFATCHSLLTNLDTIAVKKELIILSALSSMLFGCAVKHDNSSTEKTYIENESQLLANKKLSESLVSRLDTSKNLSLKEAIELAQHYSLRTVSAGAKLQEADARISEVQSSYYPKLQFMAKTRDYVFDRINAVSRSNDEYAQAQISLQYNLLDFGRTKYGMDSASQLRDSAKYLADYEKSKVTFDTIKAYFDVRRYTEQKAYSQEYVKEMSDLVNTIRVRVNGGLSPQSELIRGQLALTNAQNRRKSIELQLKKAEQELTTLLGLSISTQNAKLDEKFLNSQDFTQVLNTVLANNPDLKAYKSQLNSASSDVEAAKSARYPSVDVVGTYSEPFQHPNNLSGNYLGGKVSLQVSMPIFDGGVNSSRIGQAAARLNYSKASYNQLFRDLQEVSNNLVEDALNASDMWAIQVRAERDAGKTRVLYLDEFRLGNRNLNDLLTVQTDYFTARTSKLSALYDYYLSTLGLYLLSDQMDEGISKLNLK